MVSFVKKCLTLAEQTILLRDPKHVNTKLAKFISDEGDNNLLLGVALHALAAKKAGTELSDVQKALIYPFEGIIKEDVSLDDYAKIFPITKHNDHMKAVPPCIKKLATEDTYTAEDLRRDIEALKTPASDYIRTVDLSKAGHRTYDNGTDGVVYHASNPSPTPTLKYEEKELGEHPPRDTYQNNRPLLRFATIRQYKKSYDADPYPYLRFIGVTGSDWPSSSSKALDGFSLPDENGSTLAVDLFIGGIQKHLLGVFSLVGTNSQHAVEGVVRTMLQRFENVVKEVAAQASKACGANNTSHDTILAKYTSALRSYATFFINLHYLNIHSTEIWTQTRAFAFTRAAVATFPDLVDYGANLVFKHGTAEYELSLEAYRPSRSSYIKTFSVDEDDNFSMVRNEGPGNSYDPVAGVYQDLVFYIPRNDVAQDEKLKFFHSSEPENESQVDLQWAMRGRPSIVSFGDRLYILYRKEGDNLYLLSFGESGWTSPLLMWGTKQLNDVSHSLVASPDKLYAFCRKGREGMMYKESTDGETWCEWKKAFGGLTAPQGVYWKDELHCFNVSHASGRVQHFVEKDGKWVDRGNLGKDVSPNFSLFDDNEHLAFAWRANGSKGDLSLAYFNGKDLEYCIRTDQKVIGTPCIVRAGGKLWLFAAIPVEEGLV